MNDDLTKAARKTMQGGAEVTVDTFYRLEGMEPGRTRLAGTVDFDAGRCQLRGDGEQHVIDGADEYQTLDNEWILSRGRPGTQSTLDPAWLLTRLTDAVASGDRSGDEIVGTLDRKRADSTTTGIAPDWTPTFRATLNGGRIVKTALELVGDDGEVGVSLTFAVTPAQVAPITLPEHATLGADDTPPPEGELEPDPQDSGLWRMIEAIKDDPDTLQWLGFVLTQIRPTVSPGQVGAAFGRIIQLLQQHGREIPHELPAR
ncbi:MAG TPA: hypothetical protein VMF14_16825, partial [Solirubrobacteraceae bacterium]|nr:hypothetical protein [Solirubrobacteraceae bacterium]